MSEILFADDDPAMRQMVGDLLRSAGHHVRLVEGGRDALASLQAETPDLVILDYHMGEPHGLEVCRVIKDSARWSHLPVLILTGQAALDDRIRGFDAGADDYLPKPFAPRELLARVRALLRLSHGSLDRNPTTRLPGGEAVQREFTRWCERGRDFAVCYIDLDNFKAFNDRFGFAIADAVIREAGSTLASVVASTHDFAGHVGGDDFVLICPPEDAHQLVEETNRRFRASLARHLPRSVFEEGWYDGIDREGRPARLPITRMSVAIVNVDPSVCDSLARLSEVVARTKHDAKHAPEGIVEVRFPAEDGTGPRNGRG